MRTKIKSIRGQCIALFNLSCEFCLGELMYVSFLVAWCGRRLYLSALRSWYLQEHCAGYFLLTCLHPFSTILCLSALESKDYITYTSLLSGFWLGLSAGGTVTLDLTSPKGLGVVRLLAVPGSWLPQVPLTLPTSL